MTKTQVSIMTDEELNIAIITAYPYGTGGGDMVNNPANTLMLLGNMERFELYGTKTEFHCAQDRQKEWASAKTIGRAVAEAWLLANE